MTPENQEKYKNEIIIFLTNDMDNLLDGINYFKDSIILSIYPLFNLKKENNLKRNIWLN
jgi:hypothetical protein